MEANLYLDNVEVFDISRFNVRLGQTFRIVLDETAKWFADNDSVLSITPDEDGLGATITATAEGGCEIQLQRSNRSVQLAIPINVFAVTAATLGLKAGDPELK